MAATPIMISSHLPIPHRIHRDALAQLPDSVPHLETQEALQPSHALHRGLVARPERRMMTPEQGRALETLGHAVQYLEDQMFFGVSTWSRRDGDIAAINMLKQRSREIYGGLPLRRSLWQKIHDKFAAGARGQAETAAVLSPNSRVILFPSR